MTKKSVISEVVDIIEKFDTAFEKLPADKKQIDSFKKLYLALHTNWGQIYEMAVTEEGRVSFEIVEEEVIKTHYLRNRFIIKETEFCLYLIPLKKARVEGLAIIGAIENTPNITEKQDVYLYLLNENEMPSLGHVPFDEFENITQLTQNIYIVEKDGMLLALDVGIKPGCVNTCTIEENSQFISGYV